MPTKKLRIDAWGRFYQDGKKFQKGSSKKSWTLLLGSGIHQALFKDSIDTPKQKQALEVLGSWDNFLKELFCSSETYFHFKDSPSLQWEMHAIEGGGQKMKNEMARDKERQLHKRAKHMLSQAQDVLYSGAIHSKNYGNISKLIACPSVSDIVSLNLDLGIEEILRKIEFTKKKCQPNENKSSNIKIGRHSHFIYKSDDEDEIKKHIWYPHGNIKNSASELTPKSWTPSPTKGVLFLTSTLKSVSSELEKSTVWLNYKMPWQTSLAGDPPVMNAV